MMPSSMAHQEARANYDALGLFKIGDVRIIHCWACGKFGKRFAKNAHKMICSHHPSGPVEWYDYLVPPARLNREVLFSRMVIETEDFSKPGWHMSSPA